MNQVKQTSVAELYSICVHACVRMCVFVFLCFFPLIALRRKEFVLTEAGFGGDGAASSVFIMGGREVPFVAECVAAGACLETGEVMCE